MFILYKSGPVINNFSIESFMLAFDIHSECYIQLKQHSD